MFKLNLYLYISVSRIISKMQGKTAATVKKSKPIKLLLVKCRLQNQSNGVKM